MHEALSWRAKFAVESKDCKRACEVLCLVVNRPVASPPDDVDALRALALNAIAERDAVLAERDRKYTCL